MHNDLPLLNTFNNKIDGSIISWCTPSIHRSVPRARGVYENDISISYHGLGKLTANSGIFKRAHELAAKAYGADKTLFTVNGTSGSNFIVLRTLKKQFPNLKLLTQRNTHKSINTAVEDYGIEVTFLPPKYDKDLQIFIPNTTKEICNAIIKENPDVLMLTNPTYEGLSLDLKKLIKKVKKAKPGLVVFIDEAWGAHLPFFIDLPRCAMSSGADICVQSTHKQGSGLQQTSMIHWKTGLINENLLMESYCALTTTSPSYHLLASMDGTRYFMQNYGEEAIKKLIENADLLRNSLQELTGIQVYKPNDLVEKHESVYRTDQTKVLFKLEHIPGHILAHELESKYGILVEKYDLNNILLISTFQNTEVEVLKTCNAIEKIVKSHIGDEKENITPPSFPQEVIKAIPSSIVSRNGGISNVRLEYCSGEISGEDIIPYPPGIPLVIKGEVIQEKHIEYLIKMKEIRNHITVIMNDVNMENIRIYNN